MIEVHGLAKRFLGARRNSGFFNKPDASPSVTWCHAVRNVSFQCAKGQVLALLGPNGAGKTTTLRMLSTALRPDAGSVRIHGVDAVKNPLLARSQIGFMSGSTGLYGRLSARENVEYFGRLYGLTKSAAARRCDELFEQLDMRAYADRRVDQLSTGMRQKCSIARTAVHDPQVLILDEPTSGLDIMAADRIMGLVSGYKQLQIPVIFSTHQLHEVDKLCDRVAVIDRGMTVFTGGIAEFKSVGAGSLFEAYKNLINPERPN